MNMVNVGINSTYERQVHNDGDALPHCAIVLGGDHEYLAGSLLLEDVADDGPVGISVARDIASHLVIVVVVETAAD